MSDSSDDYTLEDAKDEVGILRRVTDDVVEAIQNAENEDVLEFLIEDEKLDVIHDGERGLGRVRRAVLESPLASDRLKRVVSLRGDETPEEILVPNDVERNAKVALEAGSRSSCMGRPERGRRPSPSSSPVRPASDTPSTPRRPRGRRRTSSVESARTTPATR